MSRRLACANQRRRCRLEDLLVRSFIVSVVAFTDNGRLPPGLGIRLEHGDDSVVRTPDFKVPTGQRETPKKGPAGRAFSGWLQAEGIKGVL